MSSPIQFTVTARDGQARTGRLLTRRGAVSTPAFMPVGTAGSVKGLLPQELRQLGAEIILTNTYHLHVRPGEDLIRRFGGVARFCGWDGPVLTDSGGYQVFSLGARCTVGEDGVVFQDHIEGSRRELTPERLIEIQEALAADVMMALDDCTGAPSDRDAAAAAMQRTLRWLPRSLAARRDQTAALFGIVQGGVFEDLRAESLERTAAAGCDGMALGGVSVGEGQEDVERIVALFGPRLPDAGPRYLMGVGRPEDLLDAVAAGFDLFDCVLPTRHGRTAQLFTAKGVINMRNARHREDPRPPDPDCECVVCRTFSRAYLRHLYMSAELLAPRAGTLHNLHFYLKLMAGMRAAIADGRFAEFRGEFRRRLAVGDR